MKIFRVKSAYHPFIPFPSPPTLTHSAPAKGSIYLKMSYFFIARLNTRAIINTSLTLLFTI